jgi:hypothetical protein
MNGIERITVERQEQIYKHHRTILHDVLQNKDCQLAYGAERLCVPELDVYNYNAPNGWDEAIWEKMTSKTYKERLIIAGALIAAEIDRLQFIESAEG